MIKKKKKATSEEASSGSKGGKMSVRDKMLARKKQLESKGNGSGLVYPKEGVTRVRLKSPGMDQEIAIEIIHFYLGGDLGSVISPATFVEACPFMEKYKELKESDDDDDKELAKRLVPKRKYIVGGTLYKDEKGKEIDTDRVDKGIMIARGVYQDIIELFLDEDEWGDMTDPKEGYDIKITRSGKGKNDTEYTVSPCQKKPLEKKYQGYIDLEKIVRGQIPTYADLEQTLNKYLKVSGNDEEEEDDAPKKKFKKGLKKKNTRDI